MSKSESIYEIELKSLLSKEQYENLISELPKKMKLLSEERIHTRKFNSSLKDDIRLRCSEKRFELVHKNGHVADITRKENTIKLSSKKEIDNFASLLTTLNFIEDPSWVTYRTDFEYSFSDNIYSISLQYIENFAYILEVEAGITDENKINYYEEKIKEIILELGCEPINSEDFSERIKKYIKENNID
jgi:adenylate cyclase class IV